MATIAHAVEAAFRGGAAVVDELVPGVSHGMHYGSEVAHGFYVLTGLELGQRVVVHPGSSR